MKRISTPIVLPLLVLTLLSACGQSKDTPKDIPITTTSDHARELLVKGREALELGRAPVARNLLDQAISADSSLAIAYCYRAMASISAPEWKQYADAALARKDGASIGEQLQIEMLPLYLSDNRQEVLDKSEALVDTYPDSPRARYILAGSYQALGMTSDARREFESSIDLDSMFVPAYRRLAVSLILEQPYDDSLAGYYAERYVKLKPDDADAYIILGDVYRAQKDLEKARDEYSRAIDKDQTDPIAYVKRGHASTFLGEYDEARADYTRAVKYAKGLRKIGAADFRVYSYLYAGDIGAALSANEAVIENIPIMIEDGAEQREAFAICSMDRSLIAAANGEASIALEAFDRHAALEREIAAGLDQRENTAVTEARLAILHGWLNAFAGDYDAASGDANTARDSLDAINNPRKLEDMHALTGYIALKQGDPDLALQEFSLADPDDIRVQFYSANAEEALGNTAKAEKMYHEVAMWDFNSLDYALVRRQAIERAKVLASPGT